jgi:YjbE family integral membrane protein
MTLAFLLSIFQIILIDIVLSGDNAVVIAMAAHKLPAYQRQRAIMWGGGIAIFLRIVFTMIMAFLLLVPGLRFMGGLLLVWIACKLLRDEEKEVVTPDNADQNTLAAIRLIFMADFVMSLDNMLAVAGASHGNWKMLLMGLLVSIGIIMTCSALIARLMNRYHWIVTLGAAILAFTAGEMILGDRELASYFVRNHQITLDRHWEEYAVSHVQLPDFDADRPLPEVLKGVARYENGPERGKLGTLTFIGQMSTEQRDALQSLTTNDQAINDLYEATRHREVPAWVPGGWRSRAEPWFQLKWPASEWQAVEDKSHHYVSWIFYALVIAFCVTSPRWWPGSKKHAPAVATDTPPTKPVEAAS